MKNILLLIITTLFFSCSSSDSELDPIKELLEEYSVLDETITNYYYDSNGYVYFLGENENGNDVIMCYETETKSKVFSEIGFVGEKTSSYDMPDVGTVTYPLSFRRIGYANYQDNHGIIIVTDVFSEKGKDELFAGSDFFRKSSIYFLVDGEISNSYKSSDEIKFITEWYNSSSIVEHDKKQKCYDVDGSLILDFYYMPSVWSTTRLQVYPISYNNFVTFNLDNGIIRVMGVDIIDTVQPIKWQFLYEGMSIASVDSFEWKDYNNNTITLVMSYFTVSDIGSVTFKIDTLSGEYDII